MTKHLKTNNGQHQLGRGLLTSLLFLLLVKFSLAQTIDCANLIHANINPYQDGCYHYYPATGPFILDQNIWNSSNSSCIYTSAMVEMNESVNLSLQPAVVRTSAESITLLPGAHLAATPAHDAELTVIEPSCHETSCACYNCPSVLNAPSKPGWSLVFYDEFNDTELDTTKWRYKIGTSATEVDVIGNSDYENHPYARGADGQNVYLSNGALHLRVIHEDYYLSLIHI